MKHERCVLPVRCKHCGSVFDLLYDLQTREQLMKAGPGAVSRQVLKLLDSQSLCWECRKKAVLAEEEPEDYTSDFEFS